MAFPTYLVAILIFAILIIVILGSTLIYMIFFRKVTVVCFGANGIPPEIKKAKKKRNMIYFSDRVAMPIHKNYIRAGKKNIYFAVKIDDLTFIPYNLVDKEERISEVDAEIDKKEVEKQIDEISKSNVSKKHKKLIEQIQKIKKQLEEHDDKIDTVKAKLELGEEKIFGIFSREKLLKSLQEQRIPIVKRLTRLEAAEKKYEEIETKKLKTIYENKSPKKIFGVMPKLDVDYEWLSVVADAYEEGTKRFEFGIRKFAPLIAIVVVSVMCIIGTVMVVKYNTDMTPVEADAIKDLGDSLKSCASYVSDGQKINNEIATRLDLNKKEDTPPK